MPDTYVYRVRDKGGKLLEGSLEADNTALVANKLKSMGYVPVAIDKKSTSGMKKELKIPVICTGGFQTASVIRDAITAGKTDAVSIARPLLANNNLVQMFKDGLDRAPRPCTYCNKCLGEVLKNPLGCYEESRFDSYDAMIQEIMTVFEPPPYAEASPAAAPNLVELRRRGGGSS